MKFIEIDAVIKMLADNMNRTRNYADEVEGIRAITDTLSALRKSEVSPHEIPNCQSLT